MSGPPRGPVITKRTVIGMAVGAAIMGIGAAAFALALGIQEVAIEDDLRTGERVSYRFDAPAGAEQRVKIEAEAFDVELSVPGGGPGGMPLASHKGGADLSWSHAADGESRLHVQNTGQSGLRVEGTAHISTDPIHFTYHVLVIISGMVIAGFSAAFSARRPRGF